MDQKSKDHYKNLIIEHSNTVDDDIERLKVLSKPVSPDNAIGRLTRMEAINDKSVNDAAIEKLKLRKYQLKDALRRVEYDDDYGLCLKCEEEIPSKRMEIMPESVMCVACINQND